MLQVKELMAEADSAQRRCSELEEQAYLWQAQVTDQGRALQRAGIVAYHAEAARREAEAAKFNTEMELLQGKLDATKLALAHGPHDDNGTVVEPLRVGGGEYDEVTEGSSSDKERVATLLQVLPSLHPRLPFACRWDEQAA